MLNTKFVLLALTCVFAFKLQAQETKSGPTFYSKYNFFEIPTNIGKPFNIIQYCDTTVAPDLHSSQYTFEHTMMGKINDARMILDMKNDTIQAITIYFENERERKMGIKQAQKQFGPGDLSQNNMLNVYHWMENRYGTPVSISLAYTDHESTSEMLIKKASVN